MPAERETNTYRAMLRDTLDFLDGLVGASELERHAIITQSVAIDHVLKGEAP